MATSSPRRRWRFSLRTLLVAMAVGAVPLGLLAHWITAKRHEHLAGREVLKRGGGVGQSTDRSIRYRGWLVRSLSIVLPDYCLYSIESVSFSRADDEEMALLRPLRYLEELNVEHCQITDDGLKHLRGARNLTFIELSSTPITDAGFANFKHHRRFRQFWLQQTGLTDESLLIIGQNRGLTHLDLDQTRVGDEGCRQLMNLPELEVLALRSTRITNEIVPILQTMPKLKYLYLRGTAVDDAAVPALSELKLRQLDIRFTKISAEGFEKLKQALPNCSIEWLPPSSSFAPRKTEPFAERKATIDTYHGISSCPMI